jgi:dCMP deaminase
MNYNEENILDNRPTWDEYFKKLATLTATRSTCPRLKVGCILVNDNRLISQGYNGYLSGCPHKAIMYNGHNIGTIHAEQNAITDCAKRGVSCNNTIAYITHYPCFNCAKLLCASGIKKIYYIDDYNNDELVLQLAEIANISITKI